MHWRTAQLDQRRKTETPHTKKLSTEGGDGTLCDRFGNRPSCRAVTACANSEHHRSSRLQRPRHRLYSFEVQASGHYAQSSRRPQSSPRRRHPPFHLRGSIGAGGTTHPPTWHRPNPAAVDTNPRACRGGQLH
ncbi:unnamed protein product [Mycena citricolor]|uniref:Uncharacterized protein n=1 Tax=Mycena citricolor TaxID=2018698 RepID=A0AAD2H8T4_9AGAR|nr:unnamed protein product [Mycena citricolor]